MSFWTNSKRASAKICYTRYKSVHVFTNENFEEENVENRNWELKFISLLDYGFLIKNFICILKSLLDYGSYLLGPCPLLLHSTGFYFHHLSMVSLGRSSPQIWMFFGKSPNIHLRRFSLWNCQLCQSILYSVVWLQFKKHFFRQK